MRILICALILLLFIPVAFANVPVAPTATATNDCDQVTISINGNVLDGSLAASAENYSLDVDAGNAWTDNQIGQKNCVRAADLGIIRCITLDSATLTATATMTAAQATRCRLICVASQAATLNGYLSTLTTTAMAATTTPTASDLNRFTVLKYP